jgi:Flp pilus assembly pilin Flp
MRDDLDSHGCESVLERSGSDERKPLDGLFAAFIAVSPSFRVEALLGRRKDLKQRKRTWRSILYGALGYLHACLVRAGMRARRALKDDEGQGTVEYVALVLLVALVMFGVVTAMKTYKFGEGQQLGDLIVEKIKEAVSKVRY